MERFPKLKVAFLEGNCAWLPWLLWLLEESAGKAAMKGQREGASEGRTAFSLDLLALGGLAVVVALQFLAGHTQSSFINLVGLGLAAAWPGVAALLDWGWRRVRRSEGGLDAAALRDVHTRAYRRPNMIVGAVGNLEHDAFVGVRSGPDGQPKAKDCQQ